MGDVHDGTTRLDHMVQEKLKGITITSAATSAAWSARDGLFADVEHQLTLIDTPGHVDFTIEVERSLRVLDGAVAVFDASQGVEPQSETVWRQADRYGVPRVAFINKMDKVGADFAMSVRSIVERLGADALPVQLPLGEGAEHRGVVDLLRRVAYVFEGDATGRTFATEPVPAAMVDNVDRARARLVERCAELDPALTDRYLASGGGSLTVPELERALRLGTLRREVVPVLCGSAYKNRGVQMLLDAVVKYLPSPADVRPVTGTAPDGSTATRAPSDEEPLCALAFKLVSGQAAGTLTFVRAYSGRLVPGAQVLNAARGRKERVGRLVRMHATEQTEVACAYAGDIVAADGLRDVRTGDTLAAPEDPLVLGSITVPEAVVTLAIEAKAGTDPDKLGAALARMAIEDPSLRVGVDEETSQTQGSDGARRPPGVYTHRSECIRPNGGGHSDGRWSALDQLPLDIRSAIRPHSPSKPMGEVCLRGVGGRRERDRGWTPATLSAALFRANLPLSERTLRRGCADGSIPCKTTRGGHRRIDAAWVRLMFPTLALAAAQADDDRAA